jgi:large subunit ribosomal protein L12
MEYVYAALMLHKLKKDITEENVTSIVKASGAEVNAAQVKSLVAALADVKIEEAIKAAPVAVAASPTPSGEASSGEEKKGEKKEKAAADGKSEEQAMEGLSALFG